MGVPRPVLELMELLDDLVHERATLNNGPVRVEVPWDLIVDPPDDGALRSLLSRSWFLAPRIETAPSPEDWQALLELAQSAPSLHFDLDLPTIPEPAAIPEAMRPHVARLSVPASTSDAESEHGLADVTAELAARIDGRVVIDLATSATGIDTAARIIALLGDEPPRDLVLSPVDVDARQALKDAWPRLAQSATEHGVNVRARGSRRLEAGPPLDSMAGPAVLDTCIRAIFRNRPSLCPFPFLMLGIRDDGNVATCPAASGPSSPEPPGDGTWNAPLFVATRQGFLDGTPPEACSGCTVLPRVRRSLAEIPWADDDPMDLPVGAIEV